MKVHYSSIVWQQRQTIEKLSNNYSPPSPKHNEQLHVEAKEWLMRTTENCTILSVFIATVAFAAIYTVPGGPNQNKGIPLLHYKPFFLVFTLADVISLTLSLTFVGTFPSILTSSFCWEINTIPYLPDL